MISPSGNISLMITRRVSGTNTSQNDEFMNEMP